jgi:hypothetical protein
VLVEDEARELDSLMPADTLDHVLCVRHLRHTVGADEADGLDAPQTGGNEPVDELRPRAGRQDLRLVLEPIPRPDIAEEDLHRPSVLLAGGSLVTVCYLLGQCPDERSSVTAQARIPLT